MKLLLMIVATLSAISILCNGCSSPTPRREAESASTVIVSSDLAPMVAQATEMYRRSDLATPYPALRYAGKSERVTHFVSNGVYEVRFGAEKGLSGLGASYYYDGNGRFSGMMEWLCAGY